MIEVVITAVVGLAAMVQRELLARGERNRLQAALAAEQERVSKLTVLLMSREAPAEFAAYIEPTSLVEEFPEDAVWDESGLYYVSPSEGF